MTPTNSNPPEFKKVKKQGPVRTGLVSVILLTVIVFGLYFTFFFDRHLRMALEWVGSKANGAEVNIDDIQTSFWKLSLNIKKVQVTNAQLPIQNLVEFDQLSFKMEMDALLRGKILINDASLLGLRINNPRKKAGFVIPPEPKKAEDDKPSPMMQEVLAERDSWAKNELQKSVLGDVVDVLQSDNLKDGLEGAMKELSSEKLADSLLKAWPEKRASWEKQLAELKKKDKVKELMDQAKAIKPSKDPKELLAQVKELNKLKQQAKTEFDQYQNNFKNLTGDVNGFKNQVASLPSTVQQDIADVKNKLNIPSLDAKKSGQAVFKRMVMKYIGPYVPYIEKAKPYWEAKKEAKEDRPKPQRRGEGINVIFPITKGYPTFWLQRMRLSSDAKGEQSYALLGELLNVTTHPKVINKPIEFKLSGDLITQQILGINVATTVDLRQAFELRSAVDIASLPVQQLMLSESPKLKLGMDQGKAKFSLGAVMAKGMIDLKSKMDLAPSKWIVQAEKEKVSASVNNILNNLGGFYVLAALKGQWKDANIDIDTDFMDKFFAGIKAEIEKKVAEVKDQIEQKIKSRISGKQSELASKMSADQKDILAPLLAFDGSQKNMLSGFDQMEDNLKKQAEQKGKEKAKEAFGNQLDKLKQKVKLPF